MALFRGYLLAHLTDRYYSMLSAIVSQVISETSQIIPEEAVLNDVLFYSSTVPTQHEHGQR